MSLKLTYYGQNDSVHCTPDVVLTGDPGTDQAALVAAGYLGGKIVAIQGSMTTSANEPAFGDIGVIVPCDASSMVPFATLLNGPGEFAGAIGPSGSKKAPVVRAMWQGNVDHDAYDVSSDGDFVLGEYLYCGGGNKTGLYVGTTGHSTSGFENVPVGICTHVPTSTEPWLGVASLL